MTTEKEDRTARAIRERRERAGLAKMTATTPAANVVVSLAQLVTQQTPTRGHASARSRINEEEKAEIRREIESLKNRPVDRARRLAHYHSSGISQGDIASALGVGQPWVSKRIALTQASTDVLQKIEAGALSETAYYTKRAEMGAGSKGCVRLPRRRRPGKMNISIDAARAVVEILEHLAREHNVTPIQAGLLDDSRQLTVIIDNRAGELRDALMKR